MNKRLEQSAGMALIAVMVAIIVILGALGLMMTRVQVSKQQTDLAYNQAVAEEAARAGVELAVEKLWSDYVVSNGNTTGNWASYRYFLNNTLGIPINEDLNFNGQQDKGEEGNGKDGFETADREGWAMLEEPLAFRDSATERVVAAIDSIRISRYDTPETAVLTVHSTGSSGGVERTAVQVFEIGGRATTHTQFAILANNITCILCHAEIKSLPLERNTDDELYGTFDRVKVAALQSLLVRTGSEPDSAVAGTIYTRGELYKPNGSLYSGDELASTAFDGYAFSSKDGKITQDGSGKMTKVDLTNAEENASGELEQFANLYMNYPEDEDGQTDGILPSTFPAPYPDEDGDRYVSDEEFEIEVNTANGSIDFAFGPDAEESGSIEAGVAYGVPHDGSLYEESGLPTGSNGALQDLRDTGSYDGNLILVGTDDDPIVIDSTVAVNGDLVVKGPVKGYGQLLVRGNVYVVGDVTYDDAEGSFGESADGSENALAVIAGGSIMMGDYLTVRGVNHSSQDNKKYPKWSQYSIHARDEHRSNTVTVDGRSERLQWGYFDPDSVDAGEEVEGRQGQQYSFTTSELMLFNNQELEKALEDPDYTPRFYGLRESQPNNIYVYDSSDEHSVRYSENAVKLLADYLVEEGLPLEILERAAYHYCSPGGSHAPGSEVTSNWISEDTLRNIWYEDEMSRPSSGREFMFDGLLYSNNSVFTIVRSMDRHKSNTYGRMQIRGGVISADLGVFVPGHNGRGLNLFYDSRVERFIELRDTEQASLARRAFYFEKDEMDTES